VTRARLSIERARTSLHTRPSGLSAVALGFSIVYLVLIPPYLSSVDGNSMFAVAKSLAVNGNASVPCNLSGAPPGVVGSGGECYSAWYPLISFLAVPLILLGRVVAATVGVDTSYAEEELALVIPALAAAGAATACAAIARKLGASRRGAVLAALAAAFGTEMLTYARYFFAETTAAFLVALGVWGLTESGRRRMIALLSLGLAVLAKPPMIVIGPALGAALAIRSRNWRRLLPPTSASALGASAYLLYNWLRFGDPMQFGGGDRFDVGNYFSPDLFKIIGLLLISPGKGLLWFSPVAVLGALALWRHSRSETGMLCVAGAVGVLVVYIGYPYGGWDWGGRFLVPAIPLLCAALGSLRGRIAVVAITLAAVAAVMQIPTIIAPYERAYAEARQDGIYLEDERWTPSESPLVLMWPAMVHQIRAARGSSVNEPPGTTAKRAGGLDNQIFKVVGLWWWRPRSGGFRLFGLIVSFAAVVIAGRLLRRGTFASSRGN
jgi:hypothetical protein